VVVRAAGDAAGQAMSATEIREGRYADTVRLASPLAAAAAGPVLDQFEAELRESIAARQGGRGEHRTGHRLARAQRLHAARAMPVLSEWDGLVRGERALLPPDRQLSATLVEDYATCGFRFFLRGILGLRALDEPEERQTMDPAVRGSIVHEALNRFFREQRDRGRPAPEEAWTRADVERLLAIADEEIAKAYQRGEAGLAVFHTHEAATLRADLEQLLEEDTVQRLALRAVPREFEWRFDGVTIGGRRFRGAVDRIDFVRDEGSAWVIDYKTGRSDSYTLKEDDPFAGGTRLQLGIYAAALAATGIKRVMGRYWFVTRRGGFATLDYEHSAANARRLEAVVRAIDEAVAAGAFPAVPGDEEPRGFKNCLYCDFDRVCSRRRLADYTARANDEAVGRWQRVGQVARGSGDV
jgi:RecB family exonuclease